VRQKCSSGLQNRAGGGGLGGGAVGIDGAFRCGSAFEAFLLRNAFCESERVIFAAVKIFLLVWPF